MRPLTYFRYLLIGGMSLFSTAVLSSEEINLLTQMRTKVNSGNYEIIFMHDDFITNQTLLYRHILSSEKQRLAQLLYMDGPPREILQRDQEIGYFQQENQPFSLNGKRIVEAFPAIVYGDFEKLSQYYNFVPAGHARISNHLCKVIRVIDKSQSRYSYVIWIDEDSQLPLRVDLVNQSGKTLDQFKIIFYKQYGESNFALDAIRSLKFPPQLPSPENEKKAFDWQVNWLPDGFKEVSRFKRVLQESHIETVLFSDDVFTFSVNVSPTPNKVKTQNLRQGAKVIYIGAQAGKEIVVIGDLPEETARRIASQVVIGE